MKSESRVSLSKCTYCSKEFKYESEKRRHELSHVPRFECKVCLKKFSFVSALRRHEKQHERKDTVQCTKCGGKFRDESLLKRHMEYAHRGTHKCKKCSAILHSELALRTHLKTHRPESERQFRCSYVGCGKSFNFTHHLKHHELTHTDDKPHVCIECGKRFIQLHHLKIHQKVHKPDSWLPCPVLDCHKEFTNEYALRRHVATHKNSASEPKLPRNMKLKEKNKLEPNKKPQRDSEKDKLESKKICISNSENQIQDNLTASKKSGCKNVTDIVDLNNIDTQFEELDLDTVKNEEDFGNKGITANENVELDDIELSTSKCTFTIGKCLVTGETKADERCVCAEISSKTMNNEILAALLPNDDGSNETRTMDSLECIEKRLKDINACETCECASTCGMNKSLEYVAYEKPKLEIRNDTIIKIKNTFDIDLEMFNYPNDINRFDLKSKVDTVNSCKDILGNCIVSGDGTIGEGCLCAKMTANNQQVIQEIEEITPCPKSNWLK